MLDRVGQNPVWIGATDQKREGSWEWTDCNPFNFTGYVPGEPVFVCLYLQTDCNTYNFTGWVPGEPGNRSKEDCVELYRADEDYKGWNDLDCNITLDFVCAKTICSGKR